MTYFIVLIAIVVIFFLFKRSQKKDSSDIVIEKEELAEKNKEELKEKIKKDLEKNKVDIKNKEKIPYVFIASNSKKYHYEGCRYLRKKTMKKVPLNIAEKDGYIPCKVCNKKKISLLK